jgi:hypothetical protein
MNVVTRTRRFIFVVSAFLPDRDNATTKANLLHHGVGYRWRGVPLHFYEDITVARSRAAFIH